tara:strand:+ start:1302 stop:1760 length:459 start_codon:yes stop_codon:yes gene_type:complete
LRRKKNKQINSNKLLLKGRKMTGFTHIRCYYEGSYLFFLKNYRIEFKYMTVLKRLLKKLRRRGLKKQRTLAYKLYVSLNSNYMLSKKSKNSRMGKGKGVFIREAIKVKKFRPFIYTIGYGDRPLLKLATMFGSKTNKKLACFVGSGFDKSYT